MSQENLETILKAVARANELTLKVMGIEPDYSFESVRQMENMIRTLYAPGELPTPPVIVVGFGIYLGQVMVKHCPRTQWAPIADVDRMMLHVTLPDGTVTEARPVMRMIKFWHDRSDTIYGWCEMIRDFATGALTMEEVTNKGWVNRNSGTRIRATNMRVDGADGNGATYL